jgi:hypothetical protein
MGVGAIPGWVVGAGIGGVSGVVTKGVTKGITTPQEVKAGKAGVQKLMTGQTGSKVFLNNTTTNKNSKQQDVKIYINGTNKSTREIMNELVP